MKNYKEVNHTSPRKVSESYEGYPALEAAGYFRYWTDILCAGWSAEGWTPKTWHEMRLSRWANLQTNHGLYVMEYYQDNKLIHYFYMSEGPNVDVNKSKSVYKFPNKIQEKENNT